MSREAMKAAFEALTAICTNFPTDSDLIEAGWATHEVNAACDAYDKGRAALSLLRAALEGEPDVLQYRVREGGSQHGTWQNTSEEGFACAKKQPDVYDVRVLYASPVAAPPMPQSATEQGREGDEREAVASAVGADGRKQG